MGKNTKINWKNIFIPTIALTVICLVVALLVSMTHTLTADQIARQHQQALSNAMGRLIVAEDYEVFLEDEKGNPIIYVAMTEGEIKGHLLITSYYGYSSYVEVLTAIYDGVVIGIDIVDASGETPGLGQNILHESFINEFEELTTKPSIVHHQPTNHGEIQALTGATISAHAVVQAVGIAMELYENSIY